MIVTVAKVTDLDQFLETFSTSGTEKRREHGCKGSQVFLDPTIWAGCGAPSTGTRRTTRDSSRTPAIARQLALQAPPVHAALAAAQDA